MNNEQQKRADRVAVILAGMEPATFSAFHSDRPTKELEYAVDRALLAALEIERQVMALDDEVADGDGAED